MEVSLDGFLESYPPMPVVLVSTVFGEVRNVAPYAWHMPVSIDPPLLSIAMRRSRDTYKNIMDQGEFVVAVPGAGLLERMEGAARPFPRDVSEFDEVGLTPGPSAVVRPARVLECPINIECSFMWDKGAGDHRIVVGKVVHLDVASEGRPSVKGHDVIYHSMGKGATYLGTGEPI